MAEPKDPNPEEAGESAGGIGEKEAPEPSSSEGEDSEEREAGAPASGDDASEPRATPKKKQAKAANPDEIRDRNQRIREEAAAKRRAKRAADERRAAPARNLEAGEIVDDALARGSHAVAGFLKRNFNVVQWLVVALVVGGIGYQIFSYRRGLARDRATAELSRALAAENARIGATTAPPPDEISELADPRPAFADDPKRLTAAEKEYRKAKDATSGAVSALAQLGLAGILFDQRKFTEAKAAYEAVKNSELAARDRDAKARAIEGVGLSLEALGQVEPALRSFRDLDTFDVPSYGALSQYHQARLLLKQNQRDKAKELLKKAHDKLAKSDKKDEKQPAPRRSFLQVQVSELLASIDPSAAPAPEMDGITPEQLERLKRQLKLSSPNGAPGMPGMPGMMPTPMPAPAPAPAESAP